MVPQKPQVWSSCKAHDAMEWQRHFERHATPQMGRNCGFWAERCTCSVRSVQVRFKVESRLPMLPFAVSAACRQLGESMPAS
jgi:hypothetical protein